jgi:hypothetical protein
VQYPFAVFNSKGVQYPFAVFDRVIIKVLYLSLYLAKHSFCSLGLVPTNRGDQDGFHQGNKRTPERFMGRVAVVTAQCLNGW